MDAIKSSISLAEDWLLNSGIQNIDKNSHINGSFNSWYDLNNKKFSFAYSEITGYGINMLLYLNKINPDKGLIEKAKIAADWLVDKAFNPNVGAVLCRFNHNKNEFTSRVCTFDNAMCLNALVNLYKYTNKNKYLDTSLKIADWILSMQKKDGSFYTRCLTKENFLEEDGNKWSKQSGCFHSKISISLLNLGSLLGEDNYIKAARKNCEWSLKLQKNDGRFVTDRNNESTFLHACCYTNEGLLIAGMILNKSQYLASVKKSVEWITKNKLISNGFPAYFVENKFVNIESPDINAQVIRLLLLLKMFNLINYDLNEVELSIKNILKYQCNIKIREAYGGFYSGDAWFFEEKTNNSGKHVNSWVTMFILQALSMYSNPNKFDKNTIFYFV